MKARSAFSYTFLLLVAASLPLFAAKQLFSLTLAKPTEPLKAGAVAKTATKSASTK